MHNVILKLGPLTVYGYGLMIAIGVILAFVISCRIAKVRGLSSDKMFDLGIAGIIFGIIGAKLLYYITTLPDIIADPSLLTHFSEGFVVYGGLIAGILAAYIYARKKKINPVEYMDCAIIGVAAAQGFGRIGCFLAGCCYGKETDCMLGVTFPQGSLAPSGVRLIPTQLISSAYDFLLSAVLFIILKRTKKNGITVSAYVILYSAGRFIIEFFRNDERGNVGMLSTSQFIALFTFAAGIFMLAYAFKVAGRKKGNGTEGVKG